MAKRMNIKKAIRREGNGEKRAWKERRENSLRLGSVHVAKLPAPLESKNVFSSREIGSITWPTESDTAMLQYYNVILLQYETQ